MWIDENIKKCERKIKEGSDPNGVYARELLNQRRVKWIFENGEMHK